MLNVSNPKEILRDFFSLKLSKSTSSPARNIIYISPIVANRLILPSLVMRFRPCPPIHIPASISPMILGILNRFSIIGESRIINKTILKANTLSFIGKCQSIVRKIIMQSKLKNQRKVRLFLIKTRIKSSFSHFFNGSY